MNKYDLIAVLALVVLVASLPVYAVLEQPRMERAQTQFEQEFMANGVQLYVNNCVTCHGPTGQGLGAMPALNNPALAGADREVLYNTIAHPPHGTAMSAWHVDEGGILQGYQVEGLVTLIKNGDWSSVEGAMDTRTMALPSLASEADLMALGLSEEMDPHECRACHEEPEVHAERFGLDCSRCHTLQVWKPALLLRHVFFLDHGDQGQVACQTCHTETYAGHTCYECHDHDPGQMQAVHFEELIYDFDACAQCHPTGVEGEAARLGYGLSGQAYRQNLSEADDAQSSVSPDDAVILSLEGEETVGGAVSVP